jgi:hypothetical protein
VPDISAFDDDGTMGKRASELLRIIPVNERFGIRGGERLVTTIELWISHIAIHWSETSVSDSPGEDQLALEPLVGERLPFAVARPRLTDDVGTEYEYERGGARSGSSWDEDLYARFRPRPHRTAKELRVTWDDGSEIVVPLPPL